jgi:hypothetical protein
VGLHCKEGVCALDSACETGDAVAKWTYCQAMGRLGKERRNSHGGIVFGMHHRPGTASSSLTSRRQRSSASSAAASKDFPPDSPKKLSPRFYSPCLNSSGPSGIMQDTGDLSGVLRSSLPWGYLPYVRSELSGNEPNKMALRLLHM